MSRNPIQGVTIAFALGGSQCSAQTNVNGVATCSITADALASNVLTASFAGNGNWLASSASVPFFVWLRDTMFEDGFESPAPP